MSLLELDKIAETYIRQQGATPSFKGYHGFPGTLCTSVNDKVVHGIPSFVLRRTGPAPPSPYAPAQPLKPFALIPAA